MTFEDFWSLNKDRYKELSKLNVMLAINIAAEEAWEEKNKKVMSLDEEIKDNREYFINYLSNGVK